MKNRVFYIAFLLILASLSCKKFVEQQQQNALVSLVTNGTWEVARYLEAGNDITSDFAGYSFKFNANGTVTGTRASVIANGTWAGDINTRTITSNFPAATDPLSKLNHVWKITDSYTDSVAANTQIDSTMNILNLRKQ